MPSVLMFAPVVIVAMALQLGISASWSMPWFRYGLTLYRRGLPAVRGRTTAQLADILHKSSRFSLTFRQLSTDEIRLRGNLALGFTGVQARIVNGEAPMFVAQLGWPASVAYAFFIVVVWTFPGGSVGSNLFAALIVLAVPSIDIALMVAALERLERSVGGA